VAIFVSSVFGSGALTFRAVALIQEKLAPSPGLLMITARETDRTAIAERHRPGFASRK
jgi:hypothetical protein